MLHLEKRQASAELLEMRRRLDELEHHQEEFLAMLAHELRAPLVPIRTGIAILDRPEATDAERAWARGFCRDNGERTSLINIIRIIYITSE
ncbi:hypothetical protein [Caballeronia sp.]|uniref:hypothetical protein n=1 Tax=Caballeronia sp. TaxID=1931223 RepID=UPI002628C931|nr:hypothetical protein [Caballeronia sp.]